MPLKSAFLLFGDVENENFEGIGSERPMQTQFTQLFVLISNFELRKVLNQVFQIKIVQFCQFLNTWKGQQRFYFTQLFVLISNFELKIINFELAVPIRGPTGAWIGV